MIAILSDDKLQVEEIVEFLFSHFRSSAMLASILHPLLPGEKHTKA